MSNAIRYFKALSDETRLRLTYVLERYELSVNELVSILEMGQSRVSRHLKILTEAGLLSSRRDGLWVFYSSVKEGEGAAFLKAAMPFLDEDAEMRADVEMAARIIEDRALKTRQFFNTIAEHWDTLSREVLGGFDLAGAVCDTMPEGCDTSVDLGCGTGIVLERMRGRARQIIGVDGSPRMLELSRRRLAGVEGEPEGVSLRIGELSHLPLRDCEADFASINMVLHHLSNPEMPLPKSGACCVPAGCSWWRILIGILRKGCVWTTGTCGSDSMKRPWRGCCTRRLSRSFPLPVTPWNRGWRSISRWPDACNIPTLWRHSCPTRSLSICRCPIRWRISALPTSARRKCSFPSAKCPA